VSVLSLTIDGGFTGTAAQPAGYTQRWGLTNYERGFYSDNISVTGGIVPPGGVRDFGPPVRVNQLGYVADGPKRSTYVTTATTPLDWRLLAAGNQVVASGRTEPYGLDALSGDTVQLIDFGGYRGTGTDLVPRRSSPRIKRLPWADLGPRKKTLRAFR